ncbi:MAG: hypothetical protein ACFFCW_24305 [Candidatus Hodarchaeota archaeon]
MDDKSSSYVLRSYFVTCVIVVLVSVLFANLEYNYIQRESLPYREARKPLVGIFYPYHLEAFIPLIALLAFQPFIHEMLLKRRRSKAGLRMSFALGVGNLLIGLLLVDSVWFMFRVFAPLDSDPLANQWIRPSDYTASIMGYTVILGVTVPLWYMILIPPIIVIFLALLITPHSP